MTTSEKERIIKAAEEAAQKGHSILTIEFADHKAVFMTITEKIKLA
jgi:hypothetical protein